MKALLAGLLVLAFAADSRADDEPKGGARMAEIATGNNRFAVDLYQKLQKEPGNLFFSPTSLSIALAMTSAGARGETLDQMVKTLHLSMPAEAIHPAFGSLLKALGSNDPKSGDHLDLANRLWGQKGFHFLADFLAITRDSYQAELAEVDFAEPEPARLEINAWIAEKTRGKIENLIPSGLLKPPTRLVLTNAIYFKGTWTHRFSKTATSDAPFHLESGQDVVVPLMRQSQAFRFWRGEAIKVVELPYGRSSELGMVFLLPDSVNGLAAMEARLNAESLDRWLSGLTAMSVDVQIPRFRMTSQFSIAETLKALGMTLAFDPDGADFSAMSRVERLFLGAVVHKAFVDVNEEGTEAAAATAGMMKSMARIMPARPVVFRADHPFVFLIRDNRTGGILFLGRVADPKG